MPEDFFGHCICFLQNIVIPKPNNPDTQICEASRSFQIIRGVDRVGMLAAIEFDRQMLANTVKIEDISRHCMLAAKFEPIQPARSKN